MNPVLLLIRLPFTSLMQKNLGDIKQTGKLHTLALEIRKNIFGDNHSDMESNSDGYKSNFANFYCFYISIPSYLYLN